MTFISRQIPTETLNKIRSEITRNCAMQMSCYLLLFLSRSVIQLNITERDRVGLAQWKSGAPAILT